MHDKGMPIRVRATKICQAVIEKYDGSSVQYALVEANRDTENMVRTHPRKHWIWTASWMLRQPMKDGELVKAIPVRSIKPEIWMRQNLSV